MTVYRFGAFHLVHTHIGGGGGGKASYTFPLCITCKKGGGGGGGIICICYPLYIEVYFALQFYVTTNGRTSLMRPFHEATKHAKLMEFAGQAKNKSPEPKKMSLMHYNMSLHGTTFTEILLSDLFQNKSLLKYVSLPRRYIATWNSNLKIKTNISPAT